MIRNICKDELFLARKAAPALPEDLPIAQDLLETLIAHKDGCVGMAANMIGVAKRIIAFESEDGYLVMFNPVILKKSGPYETEEGCLSLTGTRKTKRWQTIKVQWQNEKFQPRIKTFSGWTAEIIQHELDDRGKFTVAGVGQELVPCVGALGCGLGRTGYVRRLGSDGHRAEHIEYGDGRDHDCNGSTHSDRSSDAGNQFFLHRITPVSEDRVEMTDDKDTIPEKGNQ